MKMRSSPGARIALTLVSIAFSGLKTASAQMPQGPATPQAGQAAPFIPESPSYPGNEGAPAGTMTPGGNTAGPGGNPAGPAGIPTGAIPTSPVVDAEGLAPSLSSGLGGTLGGGGSYFLMLGDHSPFAGVRIHQLSGPRQS